MANLIWLKVEGASKGNRHQGVHEADRLLKLLQSGKLSGDHFTAGFDDGTTQQVVVVNHDVHSGADGLTVNFAPGVVP